ncbi:S-layer homology domain-containing protein [Solibacillus isronensis]|uniref:S-layer homology domain-containing protein n=1 Tax=Solibacillus isronensis TaxID=412383 RepID=UPI0020CA73AD|nr:S-layer homology domain-containing protein [Solibacillus isronensis]
MNQSKKIIAALVAVPASVVVAGTVQAEEVTTSQIFEIKNSFTGISSVIEQTSTKTFKIDNEKDLKNQILIELASFNKGFTITYTGAETASYKIAIEKVMGELLSELNTSKVATNSSSDTVTFDVTEVYGIFNNMRVKATETKKNDVLTSVKLDFSVNYYDTITNGQPTNFNAAKAKYSDIKAKVDEASGEVAKIKVIHDYVVKSTHYVATNHRLASISGLSSHAYALWMYTLLKQVPSMEVRYVYGIVNGEYRSWNIVKIGMKWYHLDATSNDTAEKSDNRIQYRHFLTYSPNERRILNEENFEVTDTTYNYFKTIDNQAQSTTHIYYPNAQTSGEIYQLDLTSLTSTPLAIDRSDATTGTGRIVYYEQTSGDAANIEVVGKYLYFINDSQGKYLYRYELNSNKPELVLKEQLQSIELGTNILSYKTINGDTGFLPLSRIEDLNNEKANKVISEIQKLVDTGNQSTQTFKEAVMATRELYVALTEGQRLLVSNYQKLKEIEEALTSDVKTSAVVDIINKLDEMDESYVKNVDDAQSAYNGLSNKSAVYNYSILLDAVKKVDTARQLKKNLDSKVASVTNDDPFVQIPDFIVFVEDFLKKFDSYLPSIRNGVPRLGDIETYRERAVYLRQETEDFINTIKVIDEDASDFLTTMEVIREQYDDLLTSQKYIIKSADGNIVKEKLALMTSMKGQIEQLNELINSLTISDTITDEYVGKVQLAQALYNGMKLAQKKAISEENTEKLKSLVNRINVISEDASLKALISGITTLDFSEMTSLDNLISQVTSADSVSVVAANLGITEEQAVALLSTEVRAKLIEYRQLKGLAINSAKPLIIEMGTLDDEASTTTIQEVRQRYTDIIATDRRFEKFFIEGLEKLNIQEKRIKEALLATEAQNIIDSIELLSEESSYSEVQVVYQTYQALPEEVKNLVINKEKLLGLWDKVSKDATAFQKAIDDVNNAIEALNSQSTKEDIENVRAAYNELTQEQQDKINNYGKLDLLIEALEALEIELLNKIAAEKVVELIQVLNNESTPNEIKAARDAYTALTEEARRLVPKKVTENLEYFELLMGTQIAQAEKEAKVVMDRINRIDKTKYTEAQIKSIRLAYNSLSDFAKSFVTNLYLLIDGENYIIYQNTVVKQAKLDANAFDVYMNDISRSSTTQEIAKARSLYNNLSAEAKRHVTVLEKLIRLETMWRDPDYIELVYTYYPDYIHDIKPGGVVIEKPTYDPLYIPDDSASTVATSIPKTANWSQYETMTYQNGRYTTQITASQVKNIADRNMRLKAGDIEIVIPTSEIQSSAATVGVSVNVTNNQLHIQFTEGNRTKTFESTVEIHIPVAKLKANTSQVIQRVLSTGTSPASFKVDGSKFIIRTVTGGTFKASNSRVIYTDIPNNDQGRAIRELTKRGIVFNTKSRLVQSYKQVSKLDAAVMIASALDVSSNNKSKYLDIANTQQLKLVQGLLEAGIMSGATSSRFAPNATVTKQEAAIIIANMYRYLNQDLAKAYNELNFSYSDITNLTLEARQSIAILKLFGVVDGKGLFNPEKTLSRGEFAELIYNALIAIDYL